MKTLLVAVGDIFPGTGDIEVGVYDGPRFVAIGVCEVPCLLLTTRDIGRVAQVDYTHIDEKTHKLVGPVFLKWRDDLSASVATLGQDDELVRAWGETEDLGSQDAP